MNDLNAVLAGNARRGSRITHGSFHRFRDDFLRDERARRVVNGNIANVFFTGENAVEHRVLAGRAAFHNLMQLADVPIRTQRCIICLILLAAHENDAVNRRTRLKNLQGAAQNRLSMQLHHQFISAAHSLRRSGRWNDGIDLLSAHLLLVLYRFLP